MKLEDLDKRTLLKRRAAEYLLYLALFLMSFITLNLLITTILFIFRVSVQPWYIVVAGILSVVGMLVVLKKRDFLNWKSVLSIIVLPMLIIIGLTVVNGKIYDYTYDGNNYHKLTIGMMVDGWNPLYETESEFDARTDNPIDLAGWTFHWGDYYAKASHIFAANMAALTGNVESGKVLNDISIVIVFAVALAVCLYAGKTWVFSVLFSAIMVTPSTIVGQFLTNYVDILLYLYMFLLITLMFGFEYMKGYCKELLVLFFMTLVMLINIKFSSFAYAGILCACYYVWYLYRYKKEEGFRKFFKNFTWTVAAAVLVGVFVVGLSVYPRNMVTKGSPFYPLFGSGIKVKLGDMKDALDDGNEKIIVDIMSENSPAYFASKSNVERFLIATFSKMDNMGEASGEEAEYKIPFTISEDEWQYLGQSDLRISGNGVFFGGILIVSVIVIVCGARKLYKEDRKLFIMIAIPLTMTLVLTIIMSEVWWARYFPQIHFVVFASLIMLDRYKGVFAKVLMYGMMGIIMINNMMFFGAAVDISRNFTAMSRTNINYYKSIYKPEECKISLETNGFPGAYYDGKYAFSEYEIIYRVWVPEDGEEYVALTNPYLIGKCEKK